MKDYQSLSHTEWDCKYHVVYIPKRWKQRLYGALRHELGKIFHEFANQKGCQNGTVAKILMSSPFVLLKGLIFQRLCSPDASRLGDAQNKIILPDLSVAPASLQCL